MKRVRASKSRASLVFAALIPFSVLLCVSWIRPAWVWSLSAFAYLPNPALLAMATLLVIAGAAWFGFRHRSNGSNIRRSPTVHPLIFDVTIILVCLTSFVLLKPSTFLLGDGDLVLANLSKAQPTTGGYDIAVIALYRQVRNLIGLASEQTALAAFRVVSIACGLMSALITLWASRHLTKNESQRRAIVLLILSGGVSLLFFGYVEYYPPLCLFHLVFAFCYLLAIKDARLKWLAVLCCILALTLHPVSVCLIPSVLYLLCPPKAQSRLAKLRPVVAALVTLLPVVLGYFVLSQLDARHLYYKLSVLPIVDTWYTVDSYKLFSPQHIWDYANLLFMLAPGLLVLASLSLISPQERRTRDPMFSRMLVLLLPAIALQFVLDPKLGMPRDWDMLSFAGIPLIIVASHSLCTWTYNHRGGGGLLAVVIAIQIGILGARAIVNTIPEASIAQTKMFLERDPGRSRVGYVRVASYYLHSGDTLAFKREERARHQAYPVERYALEAQRNIEASDFQLGEANARAAIRMNPRVWEAWINLARSLRARGQFDSSLYCLQVADALNRSSFLVHVELGMAYLMMNNWKVAESTWLKALKVDSSHFIVYGALGNLYADLGDSVLMEKYFKRGLDQADFEPWVLIKLANYYVGANRHSDCTALMERLADLPEDSSLAREIGRICGGGSADQQTR